MKTLPVKHTTRHRAPKHEGRNRNGRRCGRLSLLLHRPLINRRMAGEGITLPPNVLLPPFAELRSTSTPCRARPFPSVRENRGGCVSREGALLSTSPARAGARARVSSVSVQSGGMRVRGAWENWGLKEARASGSKFPVHGAGRPALQTCLCPRRARRLTRPLQPAAATRRVGLIIPDKFEPRL